MAIWDILVGKAANLVQLSGLDAATLITIGMTFLRFHQANKECRKLQGRVRTLQALMTTSDGGRWITQRQQQNDDDLELAGFLQVPNVLSDAQDLVESYKRSSLYARVRGGRGMATRFRDLRGRVDSCCHLILAVNAFLVVVQVQPLNLLNHPPPSSFAIRTEGTNDDDVAGESVQSDAAEPSSTAAPDDTHHVHVIDIDITPAVLPARND